MKSFYSNPRASPLLIMLSLVLTRRLCQVVAEVSCKSYPNVASAFRTFSTSVPTCGEDDSVVTYSQLKNMLSKHDIQLFDVRNPDEYQAGNIPQAVNIPLDTLEDSLKLDPELFEQNFKVRAPGKDDDNIVFHCRSGKRSFTALSIAHQQGFSRARHYKGGYSDWVEQQGK
ncbi:thiosulfate:glutathione sulfurtransferase-like isoform X2 [Melanotaenia boesemani]|uniref:thiosulfate:glutathione sulfurtransferase-like isoform X2 n=1 Tax=Melanotaenia boesemani TaxID=1250792 RepID=UPI001C0527A6|nr:thiosulfate:glutathione sulfurtransferase-like isoform X2 [Melanotaenia boesemani]